MANVECSAIIQAQIDNLTGFDWAGAGLAVPAIYRGPRQTIRVGQSDQVVDFPGALCQGAFLLVCLGDQPREDEVEAGQAFRTWKIWHIIGGVPYSEFDEVSADQNEQDRLLLLDKVDYIIRQYPARKLAGLDLVYVWGVVPDNLKIRSGQNQQIARGFIVTLAGMCRREPD
jgi:hypothetical protein